LHSPCGCAHTDNKAEKDQPHEANKASEADDDDDIHTASDDTGDTTDKADKVDKASDDMGDTGSDDKADKSNHRTPPTLWEWSRCTCGRSNPPCRRECTMSANAHRPIPPPPCCHEHDGQDHVVFTFDDEDNEECWLAAVRNWKGNGKGDEVSDGKWYKGGKGGKSSKAITGSDKASEGKGGKATKGSDKAFDGKDHTASDDKGGKGNKTITSSDKASDGTGGKATQGSDKASDQAPGGNKGAKASDKASGDQVHEPPCKIRRFALSLD
jgi:hypothetical protein